MQLDLAVGGHFHRLVVAKIVNATKGLMRVPYHRMQIEEMHGPQMRVIDVMGADLPFPNLGKQGGIENDGVLAFEGRPQLAQSDLMQPGLDQKTLINGCRIDGEAVLVLPANQALDKE